MSVDALPEASVDPLVFRETLGHYPTGVAVVTGLDAAGEPVGMVVGTFSSISLDPPLVSFSPQKNSASFALLRACDRFAVNVLAADQEELCRRIASGGASKFDGVGWSKAPGGSPVLDDVVAWVECDWYDVIDAGDHHIVLGLVRGLATPRPVPPLLFFQGGYGKFTSPSLMAAASPDMVEAVRAAENLRSAVEDCAREVGATCSVTALLASELVTVLVARPDGAVEGSTVGQRAPHLAPLGAGFLVDADLDEVSSWMAHLEGAQDATLEQLRSNLDRVRSSGHSIALRSPVSDERRLAMAAYSAPDSTPSHFRRIRELIGASVNDYEPELEDDGLYGIYSITVPVDVAPGTPRLCVRLTGLPRGVDGRTVQRWTDTLKACVGMAAR